MTLRIRTRLAVWHVSLLAVILAVFGGFLLLRLRRDLVTEIDRSLSTRATQIVSRYEAGDDHPLEDQASTRIRSVPRAETAAQILSPQGDVSQAAGDDADEGPMLDRLTVARALAGQLVRTTITPEADDEAFRVLALPVGDPPDRELLVVAQSLEQVDRSISRLLALLIVAGPAALAAVGLSGWWLARKALSPVARMTEEAARIGVDCLGERVAIPATADELWHLAQTLNAMLERLERGMEDKRRFVADASHELRTPLAILRAELDVSLRSDDLSPQARSVMQSATAEVDRMSGIVDNLLTLARIDEGKLHLLLSPVDLMELTNDVKADLEPLARRNGVRMHSVIGEPVVVMADPEQLGRAIRNVVENAVKYTPAGGDVQIWIRRAGDKTVMDVSDTGAGIPADELGNVFDRFVRIDPARSRSAGGSGLGLAICREIVEAHGGRVWAASQAGQGSCFSLSLPSA